MEALTLEIDSDGKIELGPKGYDLARAACHRTYMPMAAVASSCPELPTYFILEYSAKVARVMEELLTKGDREWGIALAAEAMFDLTTKHKDPLPTHVLRVPYGESEVYMPSILAPVLGKSSSEVRRLVETHAVKFGEGYPVPLKFKGMTSLIGAVIRVGKQGTAILVLPEKDVPYSERSRELH